MRGLLDKMLVVFPFEEEIYRNEGIDVKFVGHPLLEELNVEFTRDQFCKRFGIDPEQKNIGLDSGKQAAGSPKFIFGDGPRCRCSSG